MKKESIKYIRTILCAKSIVEAESGNISLIELIEAITISIPQPLPQDKPTGLPFGFEVVSFWTKEKDADDAQIDLKLDAIDPKGTLLNSHNGIFTFPKDKDSMRFIFKIAGFNVTESGIYLLRLSYKKHGETEYVVAEETPLRLTLQVLQK
jgi:hypothetical protein